MSISIILIYILFDIYFEFVLNNFNIIFIQVIKNFDKYIIYTNI